MKPLESFTVDRLKVRVYADRPSVGAAAGQDVAARVKELLGRQDRVRMIFAASASQNEMLEALVAAPGIDWSRVTGFHMDEYVGVPADSPRLLRTYLVKRLLGRVQVGEFHFMGGAHSVAADIKRYEGLLQAAPIDLVCLGIGENGHLAFNEPGATDLSDPEPVRLIEVDKRSRQQQVNEGNFPNVDAVPTHALTLTVPALLSGKHLFSVVPGKAKREAVARTLKGPISADCPGTALRTHPDCVLYLDRDSYGA